MQPICMRAQDAVFCDQAAAQQEGKATSPEQPEKEALLDRLKHMEVSHVAITVHDFVQPFCGTELNSFILHYQSEHGCRKLQT